MKIYISECREYAKAVYVLERPPTLQIDYDDDQGYINKSTCATVETPLVVGGEHARLKEFPHMVKTHNNLQNKYLYGYL